MNKLFKTLAFGAMLLAGATTANAAVTEKPMPTDGTSFTCGLFQGNGDLYYFTAPSNGTLTIYGEGNPYFLYTNSEGDGAALDPSNTLSNGWEFSVDNGTTYYAYEYVYAQAAIRTMTATFTTSAGGGDVTPSDFPIEVAEWEMGQTYTGFSWKTEDGISGPSNLYTFTPESDGKLVVTQKGSDANNTHIYSKEWSMKENFSTYVNMVMTSDGYYNELGSSTYELTYDVAEGVTYYYYAKSEQYDLITSMTATFTPTGNTTKNIAEIGKEFICYNEVWEFTPEVSGIMSVLLSTFNNSIVNWNTLLYTDKFHTDNVIKLSGEDYGSNGQYLLNYYVNAGQTYYFYQDEVQGLTCTITEVNAKAPSVTLNVSQLQPMPGDASWNENISNYGSGFQYTFSPSDVSIASATVQYMNEEDQTKTVTFSSSNSSQMEFQGGGWIVRLYDTLAEIKANGKSNSYFTVTLNDIKYNNAYIDVELDEVNEYVVVDNDAHTVTLSYYKAAGEMALNSELSTWPSTIYENWEEGDVNGQAILVFTNPIKTLNEATVTLGNQTWGSVSGGDDPDPSANIPYTIDNNILTLDFSKVTLSPGTKSYSTCTIFITGVVDIYGQGMGIPSVDKKITYMASEAPDPVIAMEAGNIVQPGVNKYVLAMDEFIIQWTEVALTPVEGVVQEATVYIDNELKGKAPVSISQGEYSNVNDCLVIDLTGFEGQYGTYLVDVPQGLVKNAEGNINPHQMISCNVYAAYPDTYTVTPAAGNLYEFDGNITINFTGHTLAINTDSEPVKWGNNVSPARFAYDALIIELNYLEPGEYALIVPEGYLIIDDQYLNKEIEVNYNVVTTGVESLRDENGRLEIYNLQGQKVKNPNKGLYIINGKKVIIK